MLSTKQTNKKYYKIQKNIEFKVLWECLIIIVKNMKQNKYNFNCAIVVIFRKLYDLFGLLP